MEQGVISFQPLIEAPLFPIKHTIIYAYPGARTATWIELFCTDSFTQEVLFCWHMLSTLILGWLSDPIAMNEKGWNLINTYTLCLRQLWRSPNSPPPTKALKSHISRRSHSITQSWAISPTAAHYRLSLSAQEPRKSSTDIKHTIQRIASREKSTWWKGWVGSEDVDDTRVGETSWKEPRWYSGLFDRN